MSVVMKIQQATKQMQKRIAVKKALSAMNHSSDSRVQDLRQSIFQYLNPSLTNKEVFSLLSVEKRREQLLSSTDVITIYDPSIKQEDLTEDDFVIRSVGKKCRLASKARPQCEFLFQLLRVLRPELCLELGTCFGISAAYQAAALKCNKKGRLITLEGVDVMANIAKRTFEELLLGNVEIVFGRFQDTLDRVLKINRQFDYVFIDGHHIGEATRGYFDQIYPYLSPDAVVVFDDIHWSPGMEAAWEQLKKDDRVSIAIDVFDYGICVVNRASRKKYDMQAPIFSLPSKKLQFV